MRNCIRAVASGEETRRTLEANSRPDYRQQLEKELAAVADSELWRAGAWVRSLRPERAGDGRVTPMPVSTRCHSANDTALSKF